MKKLILFLLIVLGTNGSSLLAQNENLCTIDTTFQDSLFGIYPLPFEESTSPDGGIDVPVCLNQEYDFTFQIVLGDTLNLGGTMFAFDSLILTSITGLPEGIEVSFNPGSGTFYKNSVSCVALSGTVTNEGLIGTYPIQISGSLFLGPIGLPISFPNAQIPGTYVLTVAAADSEACMVSSTRSLPAVEELAVNPNPATGATQISITTLQNRDYEIEIHDLLGRRVYQNQLQLSAGKTTQDIDVSNWESGMYIVSVKAENRRSTTKLLVTK